MAETLIPSTRGAWLAKSGLGLSSCSTMITLATPAEEMVTLVTEPL